MIFTPPYPPLLLRRGISLSPPFLLIPPGIFPRFLCCCYATQQHSKCIASPGDAKAGGEGLKFDFIKKKEIFFFLFYFYPSPPPLPSNPAAGGNFSPISMLLRSIASPGIRQGRGLNFIFTPSPSPP